MTMQFGIAGKKRAFVLTLMTVLACFASVVRGQTTGQGALQGTILDQTGAMVPNATVTAINTASGVSSVRKSSGAGLYDIAPLSPGIYTVTVSASGFRMLKQENIEVNGLTVTGLNLSVQIGDAADSVTVTTAPPQLQTTSATVGAVITNETYESLPLVMNNQQRDPTAFATLAPGAQSGTRAPIFSGTGDYLAEVYIDGVPTTTINQQGDNRVVSNGVPVESVEQLQIVSSAPSAEYQGAGAINFAIKSGGEKYHGQLVAVLRNTIFDTWGFPGNQQTKFAVVNGVAAQVPAGKNAEHQFELSASVGGPIPFLRKKAFFFVNYDRFHGTQNVNPALFTLPTALMKQGDFTELGSGTYIYNPLTNSCSGTTCSRQPFRGVKNGVATANVIPQSFLSPVSQYEQKFLPDPNLPGLVNNYITGGLSGFDNHEYVTKFTYNATPSQRIAFVYSHGVRQSIGYGANLPLPYTAAQGSVITPYFFLIEHNWVLTPHMVNQITYGYTRFSGPVTAPTADLAPYRAADDIGITGLPAGQASENFPSTTFTTSTAFSTADSPWVNGIHGSQTVPNAYSLVDNFIWTKGQHNITIGFMTQWLQSNAQGQTGPSAIYAQSFSPNSTANFIGNTLNSGTAAAPTGYAYASFLLGAVNSGSTSVPLFNTTGSRFHPISPYVQDDWKLTSRLTVNLGLRWDYLPPYHEAQDRFSYLNTAATNSLTGSPGQLIFAGYRGSNISCECQTPVKPYLKNFGPRLGIEFAPDDRTVFKAGFAIAYSHGGGVGGRGSNGPSTLGYGSSIILPAAVTSGAGAGPSFYLNNSSSFQAAGASNLNFGGPGFVIPPNTPPNAAALTIDTGNYVDNNGKYVTPGGAPPYLDPYLASRAPEFAFYNLGVQRALTSNLTVTLNYSGSQSHFVDGALLPGVWSGQLNPSYVATLGSTLASDGATNILSAQATPANIAIAQGADPRVTVPYAGYAAAGAISTTPKISRMLQPFPQYSSTPSASFSNIGNISYNSLQLTVKQREFKGVSFTMNYTFSRNIGDDDTSRSAFPVPAAASSNGIAIPGNNRADRDVVTTDLRHNLNAYGVYKSPFGKDKIGGDNRLVRYLAGGWQLSEIFTFRSGTPIYIIGSGCTFPSTGTCMPDLVQGRKDTIRKNGDYASVNHTYKGYSQTSYLDGSAFSLPNVFPLPGNAKAGAVAITKIGTAPRYLGLRNPSVYNLDASLQRSFPLKGERVRFVFRADCIDVLNHVSFSMPQSQTWSQAEVTNPGSTTFGKLTSASGNRRFQLSGRVTF